MKIVLFDIDGTLIRSGGAGRDALDAALAATFGKIGSETIEVNGRTDRGIARSLFQHHGLEDSHDNWYRLRTAYLQALPECLRNRRGAVLPGIAELLLDLDRNPRIAVGLLTGNVREGARIKLSHFALDHHFPFGGFGDDHCDRDDVARAACQAAGQHLGRAIAADAIWVIGDTPWDIRCARCIGAKVAAVATGACSSTELAAHAPDLLLEDLADFQPLLDNLLA
jgi:phosphoglycolate phosphatase-like HAD superfamily hydrolase